MAVLIYILVALAVFLIARELWCWYWKINDILEKLDEISQKLDKIK